MDARVESDSWHPVLDGERVIWSGSPRQGWFLAPSDGLLIPFNLLWGGFAIYWESSVLRSDAPLMFRLWGVPFVLVGLYLIVGRFAVDAWFGGKARYALTNRRILIGRSGPWGNFTALSLDRPPAVQLRQQANGRGTLRFGPLAASPLGWGGRGGNGSLAPALDPTPQFIAIEDAQGVVNQIQSAIRGNS